MGSRLSRLWKHWAVKAVQGDDIVIVRINGMGFGRKLVSVTEGSELAGLVTQKQTRFRARIITDHIRSEETWMFELAPHSGI